MADNAMDNWTEIKRAGDSKKGHNQNHDDEENTDSEEDDEDEDPETPKLKDKPHNNLMEEVKVSAN